MNFELTKEQEDIKKRAHEYALKWKPYGKEWDENDSCPQLKEVVASAREYGLAGMTMPKEYGGQDLTVLDWVVAVEETCRTARTWIPDDAIFMTSGPGPSIIMRSPNEEARKKYLPPIVRGEELSMVAITEPEAGSAMTDLTTSAKPDGKGGWVINGDKRFISGELDNYVVFVRFGDIPGARGVGAVLVRTGTPGFRLGRAWELTGIRGLPHRDLHFEDCHIPPENLLFKEGNFRELMEAFNLERMHNMVLSLGFAEAAFDETMEYVQNRKQFGRAIIEFQGLQWKMADMWIDIQAAKWLVYMAAATAVEGKYPKALEATTAKLFANRMGKRVTEECVSLHGGYGFSRDYVVERLFRDNQVMPIAGGTIEMLQHTIASQLFAPRKFPQRLEDLAKQMGK